MIATNGSILTKAGMGIITDSMVNNIPIEFTTIKIGSGVLKEGEDPSNFIDLIEEFKDIGITSIKKDKYNQVRLRGSFNNIGILENQEIREVGVYAKTANIPEVLYSYVNDGLGEIIPPEEIGLVERVRDIISKIDNSNDVTVIINSSAYATIYDLEEGLATKSDKEHTHDFGDLENIPEATEDIKGISEIATQEETTEGLDDARTITPKKLKVELDKKENTFEKKSGFNKDKSDSVNSDDSETLGSSKAVKTAHDKGEEGLNRANEAYTLAEGKSDSGHNHDTSYLKLSGGSLTGALNVTGNTSSTGDVIGFQGQVDNQEIIDIGNYENALSDLKELEIKSITIKSNLSTKEVMQEDKLRILKNNQPISGSYHQMIAHLFAINKDLLKRLELVEQLNGVVVTQKRRRSWIETITYYLEPYLKLGR